MIVDKPAGLTSHDVIARVRRILHERRVGHTGTLDPFATGVLVVLVGRATRLAQFLSGAEKEYEAVIRMGYATDTGDMTGARRKVDGIIDNQKTNWTDDEIEAALDSLRGEIEQVPPMYSAKKVAGQKLYELARRGIEVERKAVRVHIYELEAVETEGALLKGREDGAQDLSVRVVCSAGTYVRTLAESVGERLGAGAHLASLRRTRAGSFKIGDAVTLEELEGIAQRYEISKILISTDAALSSLPFMHLTSEEARRASNGQAIRVPHDSEENWPEGKLVRMRDEQGNLIAVGVYRSAGRDVHPSIVLSQENKG